MGLDDTTLNCCAPDTAFAGLQMDGSEGFPQSR